MMIVVCQIQPGRLFPFFIWFAVLHHSHTAGVPE